MVQLTDGFILNVHICHKTSKVLKKSIDTVMTGITFYNHIEIKINIKINLIKIDEQVEPPQILKSLVK